MNTLTVIALLAASIHPFGKQPSEPLRADSISIYYSDETQPEKCDEGMTIEEFLSESTAPRFPDAYSQPYDSLVVALKERRARAAFDDFFDEFINIESVPCDDSRQLPDSVYEARLRMILSPIHMPYNEVVKRYIITYTTRKTLMENVLGRSQY